MELFPQARVIDIFFLLTIFNKKFNFFFSVVDEDCFPYIAGVNRCKVKRTDTLQTANCNLPTKVPRKQLYKVGPAYSLNNETDIMIEIYDSGPVQGMIRKKKIMFKISNELLIFNSYNACLS